MGSRSAAQRRRRLRVRVAEVGVRDGLRDAEPHLEAVRELVEHRRPVVTHDDEAVVAAAEEHAALRLVGAELEPLGDRLRPRGRGIRHRDEHRRGREPAPQVADDAAGERRGRRSRSDCTSPARSSAAGAR